jgi:hexokinase
VLSAEGVEQVSTTSVEEKNGWIHLFAQGFTFSNPTLRVKMTQAPLVTPTEQKSEPIKVATPKAKTVTKKLQKTISCKRSKSIKKITGQNPKCPSGYVKS